MKNIYDRASNVVVWLGEDLGFASDAVFLIQRVAKIAEKEGTSSDELYISQVVDPQKSAQPEKIKSGTLLTHSITMRGFEEFGLFRKSLEKMSCDHCFYGSTFSSCYFRGVGGQEIYVEFEKGRCLCSLGAGFQFPQSYKTIFSVISWFASFLAALANLKRSWPWLSSSDSVLSPFVAIAVMVAGSVSVSSAVNAEDTAFTSSAKDVIAEAMWRFWMDIYKSRERGREDVSINTGISERRKSLALSGDRLSLQKQWGY
jgi:hypothetical protein